MNATKPIEVLTTPVFQRNAWAYKSSAQIICNEGGSRCFAPHTNVITINGPVAIKDINRHDIVITPTGLKPVIAVHKMQNTKRSIRLKLKNGAIIECTEDHKFMFNGRWIELKNIVSLLDDTNTRI